MTDRDRRGQLQAVPSAARELVVRKPLEADFDELFVAHYGFVCRALHSMGVDAASVEDRAQDVFVVLHRRLADYDERRDIRSWLWGIARRVASTHERTSTRAQRKLRAIPDVPAPRGPDERVELREEAAFVRDVLAAMPDEQREVFVLMEIETMSAPEIAEALGLKLNTVYSRLRAARERFKDAVAKRRRREGAG
jgi:RNA polymerase sigma-70 factor (ECF subfamily)